MHPALMAMSHWLRWFTSFLHRLTFDSVFMGMINNKNMYIALLLFTSSFEHHIPFKKQLTAFNIEESAVVAWHSLKVLSVLKLIICTDNHWFFYTQLFPWFTITVCLMVYYMPFFTMPLPTAPLRYKHMLIPMWKSLSLTSATSTSNN